MCVRVVEVEPGAERIRLARMDYVTRMEAKKTDTTAAFRGRGVRKLECSP